MYKIITIMMLSIIGLHSTFAQTKTAPAELSKESKKKIKAELKEYLSNPQKYQADQEDKKNKIKNAEKELEELKSGLRIEKRDLEFARDSVRLLMETVEELKNIQIAFDSLKNVSSTPTDCAKMPEKGIFYKVQIGNFSSFVPNGFNGTKTFSFEVSPKASKRFLAGYFSSFEEAAKFTEDVKKMGIKDAFVTQYQNGTRNESFDPQKEAAKLTTKEAVKTQITSEKTPAAASKPASKASDNFTVEKQAPPVAPKKK